MFGFLNPIFLFAAASAIIPIVLHMIQSRRTVKLPFSTIRFLQMAEQNASRRIRMEYFLLWLLRTLLLLIIALAFAVPILRTRGLGSFLKRSQRDVAIVLDTSYSMHYTTGSKTVWDKAIQSAVSVLEGLEPGDQVCIFAAEEEVRPVIEMLSQETELAVSSVRALEPGFFSSRLAPAVMAANDSLKEEPRRREREIHVITDRQLLPWTGVGREEPTGNEEEDVSPASTAGSRWNPAAIDDKTAVFFTLLGVESPENTTPVGAEVSPELLTITTPFKVTAGLAHSGPPRNTAVTAFIDDRQMASRSIVVGTDNAAFSFAVPPIEAGIHSGSIELPPDNLPADNTFHFIMKVREQLPTLCIGDKADSLFLMKALTVSQAGMSGFDIKRVDAAGAGSEISGGYSCIFLCNAVSLSGQEILSIERHVRGGGLLVIFPGNRATVADYESWTCLPAKPLSVEDVPVDDRKNMLRWTIPRHPILRDIAADTGISPVITTRRRLKFGDMEESARVVVSADIDTPFILERKFGNGSVLFINVSADRTWSSFPLSPFYLPIMRETVRYGAFVGGFTPFIWTSRALSLGEYLPGATRESVLQGPDGNVVPIRSAAVDGETVLFAEGLTSPGIYTMLDDSGQRVPALAVNLRREESNLTPVDPAAIPKITGLDNAYVSTSREELLKHIEDHRVGNALGELLLWVALVLATLEFCYANTLSRSTPRLSEALGIASSGKVKG